MNQWNIWSVQQLRANGWTRARLTSAVESGTLWRLRKGYYAAPTADRTLMRAVRLGCQLTGPSALPHLGTWQPLDDRLHVAVPENAARLSDPDHRFQRLAARPDLHVHWRRQPAVRPRLLDFTPIVDLKTALADSAACCPRPQVVAAIDSALNRGLIHWADLPALQTRLPGSFGDLRTLCDGGAQAGTESVIRVFLRQLGLHVEVQAFIRGVGHVDLLVEGRLVIEADSREFHDVPGQFAEDRRRDLELSAQHYAHLRLTYRQVFFDWPACQRAILAALAVPARMH